MKVHVTVFCHFIYGLKVPSFGMHGLLQAWLLRNNLNQKAN